MKTTMNIPEPLIMEAMQLAQCRTKTQAIVLALEELIRMKRLERVIAAAGSLHLSEDWDKLRHGR